MKFLIVVLIITLAGLGDCRSSWLSIFGWETHTTTTTARPQPTTTPQKATTSSTTTRNLLILAATTPNPQVLRLRPNQTTIKPPTTPTTTWSTSSTTTTTRPTAILRRNDGILNPKSSPANSDIFFPNYEDRKDITRPAKPTVSSSEIPVSLLEQLNRVNDISEFMRLVEDAPSGFAIEEETEDDYVVEGRFGLTEAERNSGVVAAKAANCIPENQTVPLATNDNPLVIYYPKCTRIERCGGCCSNPLLVCEPTKSETVLFRVVKTEYTGGMKMSKPTKETIPVEKHLACTCACRIKESDCNKLQEYDGSSCICKCTNLDDKLKCEAQNHSRVWDSKECVCGCREVGQCSTGYFFDQVTCRCVSWSSATARHGVDSAGKVGGERGRSPGNSIVFKDDEDTEDKEGKPVERVPLNRVNYLRFN